MAMIGKNFNSAQLKHQAMVRADMNTVDAKEASHAAQTGASGTVAKQAKPKDKKPMGEKSFLSDAAQKALDKAEAKDTQQDNLRADRAEGRESVADDMALRNKTRRKGEDEEDDKRVGAGDVKSRKAENVFQMDDGDGVYEVTDDQAVGVKNVDDKSKTLNADMPEANFKAASATVDANIKAQGIEKVSDLKTNDKIDEMAQKMDLDPVDPDWKETAAANPEPIHTTMNKPEPAFDDDHNKALAGAAAAKQMQAGGGNEAFTV